MLLTKPQRPAPSGKRAALLVLAFGMTLFVHAALVGLIVLSSLVKWDVPDRFRVARPAPSRPVTLRGLTFEQFEKNRGPAGNIQIGRAHV